MRHGTGRCALPAPCTAPDLWVIMAAVDPAELVELLQTVASQRPLTQCITNYVSMDIMANVLLAAKCSPAMVHAVEEVEEFQAIANGLLINMGTLSSQWVQSMKVAAAQAVKLGKPWVLDPVGCGATRYRTNACLDLLHQQPDVVRGNGSEVLALAGADAAEGGPKGVDSTVGSESALAAAVGLAKQYKCTVAVSGAVDLVTDGSALWRISNGVPGLQDITASGCSVTAMIAAFVAAAGRERAGLAAAAALALFGLAAELSSQLPTTMGPGSLRVGLLDYLSKIMAAPGEYAAHLKVACEPL